MQLITLLSYIEAPPTLSPSGDTKAAAFTAQVAAYKHDDPPMVLTATVWGDAAARAAANIRAGSYWILSGRFKIEKSQRPRPRGPLFRVGRHGCKFHPGGEPPQPGR